MQYYLKHITVPLFKKHHSASQFIQFPENWHIWLKRGRVILVILDMHILFLSTKIRIFISNYITKHMCLEIQCFSSDKIVYIFMCDRERQQRICQGVCHVFQQLVGRRRSQRRRVSQVGIVQHQLLKCRQQLNRTHQNFCDLWGDFFQIFTKCINSKSRLKWMCFSFIYKENRP